MSLGTVLDIERPRIDDIQSSSVPDLLCDFQSSARILAGTDFLDQRGRYGAIAELALARLTGLLKTEDPIEGDSLKPLTRAFQLLESSVSQGDASKLPIEYRLRYLDLEVQLHLSRLGSRRLGTEAPPLTQSEMRLLGYLREHKIDEISIADGEAAQLRTSIREALGHIHSCTVSDTKIVRQRATENLRVLPAELTSSTLPEEVRVAIKRDADRCASLLENDDCDRESLSSTLGTLASGLRFAGALIGGFESHTAGTDPIDIAYFTKSAPRSYLEQAATLSKLREMDHSNTGNQKGLTRSYTADQLQEYLEKGAVIALVLDGNTVRGMEMALPHKRMIASDTMSLIEKTAFAEGNSLYLQAVCTTTKAEWPNRPSGIYHSLVSAVSDWALSHGNRYMCGIVRPQNTSMAEHAKQGFEIYPGTAQIICDPEGKRSFTFHAVERDTAEMMRRIDTQRLPLACSWEKSS